MSKRGGFPGGLGGFGGMNINQLMKEAKEREGTVTGSWKLPDSGLEKGKITMYV